VPRSGILVDYGRISISGRKKNTRKAPAYRINPLNVAHAAYEKSKNAQEDFPTFLHFPPFKAVPLIGNRQYSVAMQMHHTHKKKKALVGLPEFYSTAKTLFCLPASTACYRRTSISGTTFSGKKCLSGTIFHAI
jgi:hypothetical protein